MKRILITLLLLLTFVPSSFSARLTLEEVTNPAYHGNASTVQGGDVEDTMLNNATRSNANFTELYGKVIDTLTIVGDILTITMIDATQKTVDLSSYVNTDDQLIMDFSLTGNVITLELEDGGTDTVDLTPILGGAPQHLADCSGITGGFCIDTGDQKLYVYNGTAVVEVPTGTPVDYTVVTTVGDPGSDTNIPSEQAVSEGLGAKENSDADLTAIAALGCTDDQIIKRVGGVWDCAADTGGSTTYDGSTVPYRDTAGTAGNYRVNGDNAYFYNGTYWFTVTGADNLGDTPGAPPTLSSATVPTTGDSATLVFNESVSIGAGGNGTWNMDCPSGTDITMTYSSGAPGTSLVYTLGSTVYSSDSTNCNVDYTQPGDGIETTDDGADLASITDGTVTNNSTESAPIADDFSSDTSGNYTSVLNNITISGGVVSPSTAFQNTVVYHSTSTGTNNHYAELTVRRTTNDASGILFSYDTTNGGYTVKPQASGLRIVTVDNAGAETFDGIQGSYAFAEDTDYVLRLEITGTSVEFFVDTVSQGSYTITPQGQYTGLFFDNGSNESPTADDFSAGAN